MKSAALLLSLGAFVTMVHAGGWEDFGNSGEIHYCAVGSGEGPVDPQQSFDEGTSFGGEHFHFGKRTFDPLKFFDEVLQASAKANHLQRLEERGLEGGDLLYEEAFQNELLAALRQNSPRELQAALKSSGNEHNPKMYDLWEPFQRAVLSTPTIAKLNATLGAYGLCITGVAVPEKLELRKADDGRRFFSGMGLPLKVSKIAPGIPSSDSKKL